MKTLTIEWKHFDQNGRTCGANVQCRTLEHAGKTHKAIPAEVICEAACRVVGCDDCGCSEGKSCGPASSC